MEPDGRPRFTTRLSNALYLGVGWYAGASVVAAALFMVGQRVSLGGTTAPVAAAFLGATVIAAGYGYVRAGRIRTSARAQTVRDRNVAFLLTFVTAYLVVAVAGATTTAPDATSWTVLYGVANAVSLLAALAVSQWVAARRDR